MNDEGGDWIRETIGEDGRGAYTLKERERERERERESNEEDMMWESSTRYAVAYLLDNVERSIHKNVREIGESSFSMGRSWVGCASEMRGDVYYLM